MSDPAPGSDPLAAAALAARAQAYAPYSRFLVGAAIEASDGRVFAGCNVEYASYPLSVCAERNAIAAAVVAGVRSFRAIAIATDTSPPSPPCGACRQALREFGEDLAIELVNLRGERVETSLATLLPMSFGPEHLKP
jgi:cytidine deaminase